MDDIKKRKDKKDQDIELKNDQPSVLLLGLLIVLYLAVQLLVTFIARSQSAVRLGEAAIPVSAFTGVFSSMANIFIIFMVLFCKKRGYIIALLLLLVQFPFILQGIFINHSVGTIPGIFTTMFTIVAIIIIHSRNKTIEKYRETEIKNLKERQKFSQRLFEQTATALVNAIDAKDEYSRGHSLRVAEYSEMIAHALGKSEEECNKIYYAGLLHDVGKIGISNSIINKKGKLTPEEYEIIKEHSIKGNRILSSVSEYPYLSIGAHYHHERYDGKGYPDGLKGEDIPEIARIISLADAYDAMTSYRSYRESLPQQLVREEIVKGAGTQFDPKFAKIVQQMIDQDPEYKLREKDVVEELAGKNDLRCEEYRSTISDGIGVTDHLTKIHLNFRSEQKASDEHPVPSIILFDSLDERVHSDKKTVEELSYFEYCEISFDGRTKNEGTRKIKTEIIPNSKNNDDNSDIRDNIEYNIEAVKQKDHILIVIEDGLRTVKVTVALPDSTRFAYIGLTGEYCYISDVNINRSDEPVPDGYIERIAEEISFIDGPVGDIPNIQVDGYRTDTTGGIPVTDGLRITFHTMSLPTARLVWHCPYFVLFHSKDRKIGGPKYREYALIRLDGEDWDDTDIAENKLVVNMDDSFKGWEAWKKANKEGFDCSVRFRREGNKIVTTTENFGLIIKNTTIINDGIDKIYVSLTGDQCALTNIKILYEGETGG